LIERLVHASLVVATEADGQMRYGLLATVRQYAAERLDLEAAVPLRERLARHVGYRLGRAEALLLAGEASRSFAEVADIDLEAIEDRRLRVQAALLRGRIQRYVGQIPLAVADQERALAWADDSATRAKLHLRLSWLIERDLRGGLAHVQEALALLGESGERSDVAFALAHASMLRLQLGVSADRAAVLQAFDMARQGDAGEWDIAPILVSWAIGMDDWTLARQMLDARIGPAFSRGDENSRGHLLRRQLEVETWAGRLEVARSLAEAAVEQAESTRQQPALATARARRALAWAIAGDVDAAAREGEAAQALAERIEISQIRCAAATSLIVAGSQRRAWTTVVELADRTTRVLDAAGDVDHTNYRYLAFQLDALVALGELDRARALADRIERKGALGPRPSWLGVSERGRAAIALADDSLDSATEHIDRALELHAAETVPFESAKTLRLAAALSRRRGDRKGAATHEAAARSILDRIGAAIPTETQQPKPSLA
jgi:tetratricopeptide (TPR) repeat protein